MLTSMHACMPACDCSYFQFATRKPFDTSIMEAHELHKIFLVIPAPVFCFQRHGTSLLGSTSYIPGSCFLRDWTRIEYFYNPRIDPRVNIFHKIHSQSNHELNKYLVLNWKYGIVTLKQHLICTINRVSTITLSTKILLRLNFDNNIKVPSK